MIPPANRPNAGQIPPFEHSYEYMYAPHRKVRHDNISLSKSTPDVLSKEYDICVAIPRSKKFLLWYTHSSFTGTQEDHDVCHVFEYRSSTPSVRRDNAEILYRTSFVLTSSCPTTPLNTLLYGSMCRIRRNKESPINNHFVMEDVLLWGGNNTHMLSYGLKLGIMREILTHTSLSQGPGNGSFPTYGPGNGSFPTSSGPGNGSFPTYGPGQGNGSFPTSLQLVLPVLFSMDRAKTPPMTTIPYTVHHIQYRSLSTCRPHIKYFMDSDTPPTSNPIASHIHTVGQGSKAPTVGNLQQEPTHSQGSKPPTGGHGSKSQPEVSSNRSQPGGQGSKCFYHNEGSDRARTAVFLVRPSTAFDIYYLISMDSLRKPSHTYITEIAHIPDYATSVRMNSLFRNIKENEQLDAIEESDDEDDFEDTTPHKHVFLQREYYMECTYHKKFRKWIPVRVVDPPTTGIFCV